MARETTPKKRTRRRGGRDKPPVPHEPPTKRLPEPSTGSGKHKDPTVPENWKGVEPQSEEEMVDWMQRERALILDFLAYCKARALNEKTRAQQEQYENKMEAEWAKWEPETDIQDGEIHNPGRKRAMLQGMSSIPCEFYTKQKAVESHEEYTDAQGLWEDFLYYQNAWNRSRTNSHEEQESRKEYKPHTETKKDKEAKKPPRSNHSLWHDNMIRLYNKWGIGDRNKLPEGGIGPDQLHVYPDNIRHTAKNKRLTHLRERFPTSDLRLNHDAIAKRSAEVERTRKETERAHKDTVNARKYAVVEELPEDHQTYHAITERTKSWRYKGRCIHNSWESSSWGPVVANKQRVLGKRHECDRPRYETLVIPGTVSERGFLLDKKNNRRKVDVDGNWVRGKITHMVFDRYYKLDAQEQRIPSAGPHHIYSRPHYTPAGTVAQVHERDGQYTARREAHPKFALVKDKNDDLSDAEEEEYNDDHVSLPDVSEGADGAADPPDESEDEESDDEGDLFARTYKEDSGLPFRPRQPSARPDSGGSGSSSPSDDGDGPPPGGPPLKPDGVGKKIISKPSGLPKKRTFGIKGERFEDDTKDKYRWVQCTHKYPSGFEFTQRDRVPALNPGAPKLYNANEDRFTEVYPRDAPIPVRRNGKYKGVRWEMGEDGVFRKGDLIWRPVMILRKFHKDDGQYAGAGDPFKHFPELINENLPDNLVKDYNQYMRQYINRNDHELGNNVGSQPHWTKEEIAEAIRFLNELVRRHGLLHLVDKWDSIVRQARDALDKYRTEKLKQPKRGDESVRTKFARAVGLQKKLKSAEALKKRKGKIPDADLKPRNYFTAEDFERAATETTAKKRTAAGKMKGKTKALVEESESESEEIEESGEDGGQESDDERDSDDESRPLKKKRKH